MTQRLINSVTSDEEWPRFDGWLASQGLDPLELPTDRFLSLAYWYFVQGGDRSSQEGRQKLAQFEARLWRPPKGEEVTQGPWSPEAETAAFRSLKSALKPENTPATSSAENPGARRVSMPPRNASARQRRANRAAGVPTRGRQ